MPEDLTNVMAIAAGANHNLALRRDKTVVAWGANNAGQSAIPEGLSNVIAIAAGRLSSAAIVIVPQPAPSFVSMAAGRWIRASTAIVLLFIIGGFLWLLSRRRKSETGRDG